MDSFFNIQWLCRIGELYTFFRCPRGDGHRIRIPRGFVSGMIILERKKHDVNRYHIASMPTLDVSTPMPLAGSIRAEPGRSEIERKAPWPN